MTNKFLPLFILVCFTISLGTSCYYDNKDDLYDYVIVPGEAGVACDSFVVSYAIDLVPILELQCNAACHNPVDRRGNIVLETYNNITPYLADGSFLGSMKYEVGYAAMPPGSKVSACELSLFQSWIDNGAPNN